MIVADLVATLTLDDQLSGKLGQIGGSLDSMGSDIARGSQAAVDSAQREVGQQIKGYGKSISDTWADAMDVGGMYSQALADIDAVSGDISKVQSDALNDYIKQVAAGTRYNSREVAGTVENLFKAGVDYQDIMGGELKGALDLAAAGGIDVGKAGDIMAQGINQFGDSMQYVTDRDGNGYIDMLDKVAHYNDVMAQSANTSMTDIEGLGGSFENAGATLSAMGQDFETGVTMFSALSAFGTVGPEAGTQIKSMLTGLAKNADMIEGIGVDVTDNMGNYRDALDIFEDIDAVTADWSESDRANFLQDVFSSYGKNAAGNLLDYNDKVGESLKQTERGLLNEGAAADAAAARMNSLPGAQEAIAGAQERLQLAFAEPAIEAQIPGMLRWADTLNGVADAAYDLPEPVRAAMGIMTGMAGKTLEMAGEAIYAAPGIRSLADSWKTLGKQKGVMGTIARVAPLALKGMGVVGLAAAAGFAAYKTNFLGFGDLMDGTVIPALEAGSTAAQQWLDLGVSPLEAGMRGLGVALLGLGWKDAYTGINKLTDVGRDVADVYQHAVDAGFSPLTSALGALGEGARQMGWEGLADGLNRAMLASRNFGDTFRAAQQAADAQGLNEVAGGVQALGQAIDAASGWNVSPVFDALAQGVQRLEGLPQVLGNAAQGVTQFISSLASGDIQGASDQLGAGLQSASDLGQQAIQAGADLLIEVVPRAIEFVGNIAGQVQAGLRSWLQSVVTGGYAGEGGPRDAGPSDMSDVSTLQLALGALQVVLTGVGDIVFSGGEQIWSAVTSKLGEWFSINGGTGGSRSSDGQIYSDDTVIPLKLAGMTVDLQSVGEITLNGAQNLWSSITTKLKDAWEITPEQEAAFTQMGAGLGKQIGPLLVKGIQSAGDLGGMLSDALGEALSGGGQLSGSGDLTGPGGGSATILNGLQGFISGLGAEIGNAFDGAEIPTPSADFIVVPIQNMLSAAKAGVEAAVSEFRSWISSKLLDMINVLDLIPGTDFSGDIFELQQAYAEATGAPIESFPNNNIDYSGSLAKYESQHAAIQQAATMLEQDVETAKQMQADQAAIDAALNAPAEGDAAAAASFNWDNFTGTLFPDSWTGDATDRTKELQAVYGGMNNAGPIKVSAPVEVVPSSVTIADANQNAVDSAIAGDMARPWATGGDPIQITAPVEVVPQSISIADMGAGQMQGQIGGSVGTVTNAGGVPTPQGGGAAMGGGIASQVQGMFAAAQAAAQAGIAQLQATISSGMASLGSSVTAGLTSMTTAVQSAFTAMTSAITSGLQQAVSVAQQMASQITAALQSAAAGAQAAGAAIGQGLVAGLQSQLGAVQAAASQLASAAQAGMQGVIQMGSPSRMAIPYGQSIGEGLGVGMEQKSPAVQAAAEKLGYAAEQGLAPLMDSMSTAGMAAGKALGVNMEEALATKVNGLEGWDPKSQIDYAALDAFKGAAVRMEKYGKRNGDEAAKMAGDAFQGLADNMSSVLMGNGELSVDAAHEALMAYRKLDADAKSKLPDDLKDQLKATYDEANITIGDVIKQRMGGRLGEGMDIKGRFKSAKENILKGMLGMRTLEEKAQSAAEDGLGLAIDAVKQGLMSAAPSAEGAAQSAMKSALGSMGGPAGGAGGAGMGGATGSDPEGFAWALCECISGANKDMLGQLGMGNPAETGVAMLGHELSGQIAGTGDEFRSAMLQYADQNPALNLPKQFLGGEDATSCMNICDKAADTMGQSAGQAAGSAMGANMPTMPSGADFGKAAGGALQDGMAQQCVSLCGGTTDDMAQGVGGAVEDGIAQQAMKGVSLSSGGARELGKQLRSGIPGATAPGMPGATPDDMASGVSDGLTSQCVSLCDDSGLGDAAGSLDSAAGGMSDLGGQIDSLTQSMIGSKFSETLSGIQKGLTGEGAGSGDVPDLIKQLNPNIERALNFDISQTNPHAAALMGGGSGGMNAGMLSQFGGGGASMLMGGSTPATGGIRGGKNYAALIAAHPDMAANPLVAFGSAMARAALNDKSQQQQQPQPTFNITLEMDGQAVGNAVVKTMAPKVSMAAQNMRKGSSMTTRA